MNKTIAELAYDLHTGLASHQVSEFDELHTVGMAATLAVHIKGLGEIEYDVLRKVSDHYMSIPSFALEKVLRVLAEIGFVRLVERGRKIEKIIPNIPAFDDVYEGIGEFAASELALNCHEQAILRILVELRDAPRNRDSMRASLGIESRLYDRCVTIGSASGIISEHRARGRPGLKKVGFGWQLHLNRTTENAAALDLAIKLLRTGNLAGMEVNQEARIALTKDEVYIQSLISASELKKRAKQIYNEQANNEFEQLLLKFD